MHVVNVEDTVLVLLECLFNQLKTFYSSYYTVIMSDTVSDCDTVSMDGGLYELALGPDMDGITDTVSKDELEPISEEDDGINVTINEVSKPLVKGPVPRKISSVVVAPKANQRTQAKLKNQSNNLVTRRNHKPIKAKGKKSKLVTGSLISMLSKASIDTNTYKKPTTNSSKRIRSPGKDQPEESPVRPHKVAKTQSSLTEADTNSGQISTVGSNQPVATGSKTSRPLTPYNVPSSYSEASTNKFKLCTEDGQPTIYTT